MIAIPKQRGKCLLSSVSTIPQNRRYRQLNRISIKSTLTRSDSWKEAAWYWAYLAMVVWARALSQRHIFLLPVASQFSSAGWESWVHTSTRCSGLASTNVFVENSPKSAGGGDQNQTQEQVNNNHDVEDLLTEGGKKQGLYPVWELQPVLWWQWRGWRGLCRTGAVGGRKRPSCSPAENQAGQRKLPSDASSTASSLWTNFES